ncbi:TPA: HNH endonuclease [Stenotrophomonas maltophilia]|nr:HNH endonuclease [Stenotrophomonas maltophilia]
MNHRIVWLLTHGTWPKDQIDHINGVRTDNRPENLRQASALDNQQNLKTRVDNTSGYPGVRRSLSRWSALIAHGGKRHYLGNYDTPEQAYAAYLEAKSRLHTFNPVPREAP